jgi:HSP20 family molecular chaperone IbpA
MPLSKRAPRPALTGLASLQREIDQLFGRLGPLDRAESPAAGEWAPSTDVFECRGQIVVTIEVPGLTPENLRIAYKHHRLIITRQIPLDQAVDIPRAEAKLAGGVLTILIPRLKDRRGRETLIPIKWEEGRDPQ